MQFPEQLPSWCMESLGDRPGRWSQLAAPAADHHRSPQADHLGGRLGASAFNVRGTVVSAVVILPWQPRSPPEPSPACCGSWSGCGGALNPPSGQTIDITQLQRQSWRKMQPSRCLTAPSLWHHGKLVGVCGERRGGCAAV